MNLQQTVIVLATTFIMLIWYIRPLYNYMTIRKYVLLDKENYSLKRRIQSGLPALVFYVLIFGLLFYPAFTDRVVSTVTTGSILVVQIIAIFVLSRYDKRQTKYKVEDEGIRFKKRYISYSEEYKMKFKKSFLFILHKPRFILRTSETVIVIPLLSRRITDFILKIEETNKDKGMLARELYNNTRSYYIENIGITKELNK